MSGIDRNITPDPRSSLIDRHLPNTPQVQRLLRREGRAHVFSDHETLKRVTEAILKDGEQTGINDEDDDYERYGLYFSEAIGYIIDIFKNLNTPQGMSFKLFSASTLLKTIYTRSSISDTSD
jgi:hypothetical protein